MNERIGGNEISDESIRQPNEKSERKVNVTRVPRDRFDYPQAYNNRNSGWSAPFSCCYKRRVGRFYVCLESKDSQGETDLLCMVGPCWQMIFVTLGLILGVSSLVFTFSLPVLPSWVIPIAVILQVFTCVAYLLTATSNPGIEPLTIEDPGESAQIDLF